MALLDFLKRRKEIEKAKDIKKAETLKKNKLSTKQEKPARASVVKSKKTVNFSYDIIKEPHISEKATMLSDSNKYVFKVYPDTNKIEIKKAIEGIYGVDVLSVNIIKIPKKKRRLGRVQGFKSGYIKAIVKIRNGQKIDII